MRHRSILPSLRLVLGIAIVVLLVAGAGCTSKAKRQAEQQRQMQRAYTAGQEEAWRQYQLANPNSIRVNGPVANPIIPWREGLTLVQAIIEAGYSQPGNPGVILVLRGKDQARFTTGQLLKGANLDLLPGDQIILHP